MKQITKKNYKLFKDDMFGIIVGIPKESLYYNAELYIYGMRVNSNNETEYSVMAYNQEDGIINGFTGQIISYDDIFTDFDKINYYQFNDLLEFCNWYSKEYKIKHTKASISYSNTHIKPTIKRKELYKDIIDYIKMYVEGAFIYRDPNSNLTDYALINDKIDKWLEEEVEC